MKVVLLGYMASGKSTIGRLLAEKMNLNFIDLDVYIEEKEQLSVEDIFKIKGEIYFRRQENYYLKELLESKSNFVLALGGGTPCYANNMELIKKSSNTHSIYIQLKVVSLVERLLQEKSTRPLVANINDNDITEFIAKHLFERSYYYNQAEHVIGSDEISKEQLVDYIYSLL